MNSMWLFWVLGYLLLAGLLFSLGTRLFSRANTVFLFLLLGGGVGVAMTVHFGCVYGFSLKVFAAMALYAFMCELFIFTFTLVKASVTVRVLLDVCDGREVAQKDSDGKGSPTLARAEAMISSGLLARSAAGYEITGRGVLFVRCYRLLRKFFNHT